MGQADWAELGSSLSEATLEHGVTAGITPPSGGGSYIYGWNSLDSTVTGAQGMYLDLTNFTPTGSGPSVADGSCSIRGCVKRVSSPNNTGFSPMLFLCAQGSPPSVSDNAYIIGLSDADPYEIVLAKGPINAGLVTDDVNLTILETSSSQYSMSDDLWHHVRLDAIVQPTGDVLLRGYVNSLSLQPIGTTPSWTAITGWTSTGYVDDKLQINTGSAPLLGGYAGYAFQVAQSLNRRGAVDAIEVYRKTS